MSALGIFVAIFSSAVAGVLLERMFADLDADDEHKAKESEAEERGEEKSAEASLAKEKTVDGQELASHEQAGAPALLDNVKRIIDTGGIADAVMNRLQDKGISIPKTSRTTALTEAAVEAMVEEVAKRLNASLNLLAKVHTGEMTKAELEAEHPRTASAINSLSESFKKQGLALGSSVQDVMNTVVNNASGISGAEQRAIAEGQPAGTAPATDAATPVAGAANTNVAAASTAAASGGKVVVGAAETTKAGGIGAQTSSSGVTIEDALDEGTQPCVENVDAEVINNTGDGGTEPSTSVVDPTLAGGGGRVTQR